MFLSDKQIRERCQGERPMISPFVGEQIRNTQSFAAMRRIPSYGLSSRGYDVRVDNVFLWPIHSTHSNPIADPSTVDATRDYRHDVADSIILPPGMSVLCQTMEYFIIPRDIMGVCWNKSTLARVFIDIGVTPLEPEWEGILTIEVMNKGLKPVPIYAGQGICQICFDWNPDGCEVSYSDRKGKYMGQTGTTVAKV